MYLERNAITTITLTKSCKRPAQFIAKFFCCCFAIISYQVSAGLEFLEAEDFTWLMMRFISILGNPVRGRGDGCDSAALPVQPASSLKCSLVSATSGPVTFHTNYHLT